MSFFTDKIFKTAWKGLFFFVLSILFLENGALAAPLSIATGGTGGLYFSLGSGMAALISKYLPNVEAKAVVTGASADNCNLLSRGRADLAFTTADTAWQAFQGKGFKEKVPLKTVAAVYPIVMHLVTLENKGIDKVTDLKGKRVSTGAPESWTEMISQKILEVSGLNPNRDIKRSQWGSSESASALREDRIDAYFWGGGVPTGSITELSMSPGLKMKLIPLSDVVPKMRGKYGPAYVNGTIPAKTYYLQEADVPVLETWNLLVCRENLQEGLVYQIVKILMEHQAELIAVQREARFLTLEAQAGGGSPIPYHPGALRYFSEKGVKVR